MTGLLRSRGNPVLHISADRTCGRYSPCHRRSRAIAAGADEPRPEWHRCDARRGWAARANRQVAAAENNELLLFSATRAWDCTGTRQTRSLTPSLAPRITAPAWDFASAAQLSNRMVAACGLLTTLRAAQVFVSPYPPKPWQMNDTRKSLPQCSRNVGRCRKFDSRRGSVCSC